MLVLSFEIDSLQPYIVIDSRVITVKEKKIFIVLIVEKHYQPKTHGYKL